MKPGRNGCKTGQNRRKQQEFRRCRTDRLSEIRWQNRWDISSTCVCGREGTMKKKKTPAVIQSRAEGKILRERSAATK